MKKLAPILFLFFAFPAIAQEGYEIKVTFAPFTNQYIYLGHYFGKTYPIIDSAMLNEKSEAVFKGNKKLQGGIYLIGYPNKAGFFEMLVDKNQHFSVIADTATITQGVKYINSPDNVMFSEYQKQMSAKGKAITDLQQQLKTVTKDRKSTHLNSSHVKISYAV